MYPWIWKHLPGTGRAKALQALVLAALVVLVCFVWLFPLVSDLLPEQAAVTGSSTAARP